MKVLKLLVMLLVQLLVAGYSHVSLAATGDTVVTVGGVACNRPTSGTSAQLAPFKLAWKDNPLICGDVTITAKVTKADPNDNTGWAKIAVLDPNGDMIQLTNAIVTATAPVNDFHITFQREMEGGPASNGSITPVYYKTSIDGVFYPNAATTNGNLIYANSYVTFPVGSSPRAMAGPQVTTGFTASCDQGGCSNTIGIRTIPNLQWIAPPELTVTAAPDTTDNRILKVDFAFKLQNANDYIDLGGAGVKMINANAAEGGGGSSPPCVVCPSLWWLATIIGLLVLILFVLLWCCRARKLPTVR